MFKGSFLQQANWRVAMQEQHKSIHLFALHINASNNIMHKRMNIY